MNRAVMIADIIRDHVAVEHGAVADRVTNAGSVAELIVDALDQGVSPREKELMIALWWLVKTAGGRVRVRQQTADKMVYGVDKVDMQPDGHGGIVFRCVQ